MNLDMDKEQFLAALAPDLAAAHDDRRRSVREPTGTLGVLLPLDAETSAPGLHVLVMNVSVHGVGFRSPVSHACSSLYNMKIGTGPLNLLSRIRIVSSRPRHDGLHDVGSEFC
jgi:hypothetical protein